MYVLLLITATTIGTVTVQQLGAFGDLQVLRNCGRGTTRYCAEVLQKPTMHFRCERKRDS